MKSSAKSIRLRTAEEFTVTYEYMATPEAAENENIIWKILLSTFQTHRFFPIRCNLVRRSHYQDITSSLAEKVSIHRLKHLLQDFGDKVSKTS
jgi:hypothetical protein